MTVPEPDIYYIPADLKRTELPNGEWIEVRGMVHEEAKILFNYVNAGSELTETWLSLGETVEALDGRTLRFENLDFNGAANNWMVTIREVRPDSPPFQPPTTDPAWHPAELRSFGTLDEATITSFEQRIGSPLPRFYRQWLAENNGAAPTQDVRVGNWNFCLNDIHPLLGIRPDAAHLDLSFGESRRKPWLSDDFLVIAVPLGGILAVKIRDLYRDQIVFIPDAAMQAAHAFDPAFYSSPTDYLARTALFVVAGSIYQFCFNLQPLPPVAPAQLAGPW